MQMDTYETEHAALVRRLAAECTVLLKKDGCFPLAEPRDIALYGSGARRTVKGGTGSGEVNSRYFITAEQGLENAGFTVTTKFWMDEYDRIIAESRREFVRMIKARARAKRVMAVIEGMGAVMPEPEYQIPLDGSGDTAVYVLSRISGEGADRSPVKGDILLTDTEIRDILWLNTHYRFFMLVLNVGGPVDLSPVKDVKNILLLSQLGAETGNVLADILLGKSYPSGKLTATWTAWNDYPEIGDFGETDDTRYKEGVFVGYRYFDSIGKAPMFPFGYGLGYTDFTTEIGCVDTGSVTVTVRNTGGYPGMETVQLYVIPPVGELAKPVRTLAAFAKTAELLPGQSETLTIPYSLKDAASYDERRAAFVLERGLYTVMVNGITAATLLLSETTVTKQVKNLAGKPDFEDWKPEHPARIPANETELYAVDSIHTETVSYKYRPPILPEIVALTDQDLVRLNIGAFDPRRNIASMIGSAGRSVAGAAGETARVEDFPRLVMADGPAGLRLCSDYTRDEKGVYPATTVLPESMLPYLSAPVRKLLHMLSRPRKHTGEILHQYCTAIPIGTAVAQSWNTGLAEALGDIVGDEMERFGIHLWLAPALNIQRSIRCGRNYEYFSEDPLISGKFAAAITRGVQKHPGRGTTVKHFVANNQETNRSCSNSMVSERALREIYLRGFEICIRECPPRALMTSYNLLNGTHTSERRDLCIDLLRCEWGFKGIIMTDWVVKSNRQIKNSAYRDALSDQVAAAGGVLFMPGSKKDGRRIMKALKKGNLSRDQLEENGTSLLRNAWALLDIDPSGIIEENR